MAKDAKRIKDGRYGKDGKSTDGRANGKGGRGDWSFVGRCMGARGIRTIFLHGPSGVGKTHAAIHAGPRGSAVYVVSLTEDMPAAELRGFYQPRKDGIEWCDGPAVTAMREGACLVINEIGHASPDVLALLYPVLESQETARLTLPTGETVVPAPGFRCIATSNDPPSSLPAALRDRFDCVIEIDSPHPEALARLPERLREAALQTFDLEPERAVSLRAWLKLAELEPELGLRDACLAVFGAERGRHIHEALTMRQLSF